MPSRLSDAFKAHPNHVHHKQLDFSSLEEVPDSYKWNQLDDYSSADSLTTDSIPVLDLSNPNDLKLIGHACRSWGAFQITNHGFSTRLLDDIESIGGALFTLPSQQKLRASRSPNGVSGYGLARISCFFPKLVWSEGFTIVGSPLEHFRQLWPQDHLKYCAMIEEYQHEMNRLAERIMWLMLGSLGITKDDNDIKWAASNGEVKGETAALQLNSYPICPHPDQAMGLPAHTDSTILTILYQNNISGLQVHRDATGWVTVPPIPGALVVNAGDLLHILSNGLYVSARHRAVVNRTQQRLSVVYLYGPPSGVEISPLSKLITPSNLPLFRPVTWHEYLGRKAKLFDQALSSVRVCAPFNGSADANDDNIVKVG